MSPDPSINSELRRLQAESDALLKSLRRALREHRLNENIKQDAWSDGGALVGQLVQDLLTGGQRKGQKYGRQAGVLFGSQYEVGDEDIRATYRWHYERVKQQAETLLSQVSDARVGVYAPGNSPMLVKRLQRADDCEKLETSFQRLSTQLRTLALRKLRWNTSLPTKPAREAPTALRETPPASRDVLGDIWREQRRRLEEGLRSTGLTDHLEAIEQQLSSSNPQQLRSAVYTCRSLVTDLADHLWRDPRPDYEHLTGQGKNGKLEVTHERAANRLAAYLHQKGVRGEGGKLLREEMERMAHAFRGLLSAQGTAHRQVTPEDAKNIAMVTVTLIGQLAASTDMQPVERYGSPAS